MRRFGFVSAIIVTPTADGISAMLVTPTNSLALSQQFPKDYNPLRSLEMCREMDAARSQKSVFRLKFSGGLSVGLFLGDSMPLTTSKVKNAGPGRHFDVHGLCLVVRPSGSRAWVLRMQHKGKRREFGLGPAHDVPLAEARPALVE